MCEHLSGYQGGGWVERGERARIHLGKSHFTCAWAYWSVHTCGCGCCERVREYTHPDETSIMCQHTRPQRVPLTCQAFDRRACIIFHRGDKRISMALYFFCCVGLLCVFGVASASRTVEHGPVPVPVACAHARLDAIVTRVPDADPSQEIMQKLYACVCVSVRADSNKLIG